MISVFCDVCHTKFSAQRNSARFCSEGCKQKAKYRRDRDFPESDLSELIDNVHGALYELEKFINDDNVDNEAKLSINDMLQNYHFVINKMEAIVGVIEMEAQNTWYQCKNCGQKTFGRVEKCEFCSQSDFKRIKVLK